MYGSQCWTVDKKMEQSIRMLRWMSEETREGKKTSEYIRISIGVVPIAGKLRENKLRQLTLKTDKTEKMRV